MSSNRNIKFPALLLIVALFAFGAVTAFASDDLGGGGGSFVPTVSADAQHIFTLHEDVLATYDAPEDATLVLLYQPVNTSGIVDATDLLAAAENLLDTDNVGASLGDWLVETEDGMYRVQLVALIPAA